ncbi:hypothetical protein R1sor_022433 [Riccia sorocarpa]|uniref:Uncharacterized protein n=1 Tax=Riccia sorocarpa TaxID=122646 RepID=A0ABD3GMU5_9MARC
MDKFPGWQRNSPSSINFGLSAGPNMLHPQQFGRIHVDSQVKTFLFPNLSTHLDAQVTNQPWNPYPAPPLQPQAQSVPDGQSAVVDDDVMKIVPSAANMRKGKRGSSSKQTKPAKAKKVKKESDDESEDGDGTVKDRWTDEQTGHLIAFRIELESEFEKASGKQG